MSNVTVTQTGGAATAAVTVSRGLQGAQGPAGATGATGATGAAGPNSITTSTSSNLTGYIAANGTNVTGATAATKLATPDTLVLRDSFGGGVSFTSSETESTTVNITNSGASDNVSSVALNVEATVFATGAQISSVGGTALIVASTNGTGATINSLTSTHLNVGNSKLVVANNGNTTLTGTITASNLSGTNTGDQFTSVTSNRLLGRHAGGTGAAQEVTVGNGLEFSGSGIRREALTGDITAAAGSNSTTLAGTIAGNKTFSGDLSFTSTTRPTSSGTGTPAATSLITLADGDARYSKVVGASLTAGVDSDVNTTTYKTVSELSFALEIGTYFIDAVLVHNGNASYATAGVKDRLNFSGTATASGSLYRVFDNATASGSVPNSRLSANTMLESAPSNRSQTTWRKGVLTVTAAGTLSVEIAQTVAVAGANTTLAAGSHLIVTRLI